MVDSPEGPKLKQFRPKQVTALFPEPHLRDYPWQINSGSCMRWAYLAYLLFDGVELWSMPGHAFVRVGGKFYDSETLEGTEDWENLPACNDGEGCGCIDCITQGAAQISVAAFKTYWRNYSGVWNWCETTAQQTLEKLTSET